LAGLGVFPLIYLAATRFPVVSPRFRINIPIHLVAVCLISIVHTTIIVVLRMALFPPLGFADESYGYLPARYPMEFAHLFIYYWVGLSVIYLFHEVRYARERELSQAKLESNLAEAQLQNLRLQLEPHFLFNVLNAISASIYENPRAADEMLGRLGELLRHLLKNDRAQLVPLARELEFLQLYTHMMEARLEDRLTVTIHTDDLAGQQLVPQLILQPLVENAIRHGMDSRFEVRISIHATCERGALLLTVRDHGPGIDDSKPVPDGIGLRNTAERLKRLYGGNQSFSIRNAEDGGAIVEIRLPRNVFQNAAIREPTVQ
jgi:sensor histidine kinase YesM